MLTAQPPWSETEKIRLLEQRLRWKKRQKRAQRALAKIVGLNQTSPEKSTPHQRKDSNQDWIPASITMMGAFMYYFAVFPVHRCRTFAMVRGGRVQGCHFVWAGLGPMLALDIMSSARLALVSLDLYSWAIDPFNATQRAMLAQEGASVNPAQATEETRSIQERKRMLIWKWVVRDGIWILKRMAKMAVAVTVDFCLYTLLSNPWHYRFLLDQIQDDSITPWPGMINVYRDALKQTRFPSLLMMYAHQSSVEHASHFLFKAAPLRSMKRTVERWVGYVWSMPLTRLASIGHGRQDIRWHALESARRAVRRHEHKKRQQQYPDRLSLLQQGIVRAIDWMCASVVSQWLLTPLEYAAVTHVCPTGQAMSMQRLVWLASMVAAVDATLSTAITLLFLRMPLSFFSA